MPAPGRLTGADVRGLVAALAGQGVTATCSRPDGPRYGDIEVDSNLPDFRICAGRSRGQLVHRGRAGRGRARLGRGSWRPS